MKRHFTEATPVERMILEAVESLHGASQFEPMRETPGWGPSIGDELRPARWTFVPTGQIPRQPGDVIVEAWLRLALIRLNPEIAAQPDRADEVIYALRAILLSVQAD